MKTNDEMNINEFTSEVEHYGIKKIKEVEKSLDRKGWFHQNKNAMRPFKR